MSLAAPTDPSTERIIDAAIACFAGAGARRTTMNEIAASAGLGVATVYRRFPQKAELVRAAVLREAQTLIDAVTSAVAPLTSVEERTTVGFVTFTHGIARSRLLSALAHDDPDVREFLGTTTGSGEIIARVSEVCAELLREDQELADLPPFDPAVVGEILARLATSLVVSPDGLIPLQDDVAVREFARVYLMPLLNADPR